MQKTAEKKLLRPILLVSEETISEYAIFLKDLLVGLADESIAPVLVCPPNTDVDSVVFGSVEIIRHPAFNLPLMGRQNNRLLIERLDKFRPSFLHCLCESKAQLTRQLARQLNLPYLLTINSLQKRFGLLSLSLRRLVKIIVPVKSIAANVATVYPKFSSRIEQINIGTFVAQRPSCFRVSGRLTSMVTAHPFKNADDFEHLLAAVKRLAIDGYEFILVLIGSGRAETHLRRSISHLGLSQVLNIVPKLEPWRSVIAAGDIFIRPRPTDAFDPLLLEAMGVGSAVAACKGGVDDLIIDDKTAVVFDPNDELSIMGTLKRLLDRHEFAKQLAAQTQLYMRENHMVSNMINAVLRIYRQTVQQPSQENG